MCSAKICVPLPLGITPLLKERLLHRQGSTDLWLHLYHMAWCLFHCRCTQRSRVHESMVCTSTCAARSHATCATIYTQPVAALTNKFVSLFDWPEQRKSNRLLLRVKLFSEMLMSDTLTIIRIMSPKTKWRRKLEVAVTNEISTITDIPPSRPRSEIKKRCFLAPEQRYLNSHQYNPS